MRQANLQVKFGGFKKSKFFEAHAKKRATMQGFADRSEAQRKRRELLGFFKNIQPISVGV